MKKFLIFGIHCVTVCVTLSKPTEKPRTVDDFELQQQTGRCALGVKIDYSYNETATKANNFAPSSPGCPKSVNGSRWVYFEDRPSCYLTGYQGPCKNGYQLVPQTNSLYGVCTCICENTDKAKQGKTRFISCTGDSLIVEQIYDREEKNCFFIRQKGPCKDTEVVNEHNETSVTCLPKCDSWDKNSEELKKKGLCAYEFTGVGCYSVTATLQAAECPPGTAFSTKLQKCTTRKQLN